MKQLLFLFLLLQTLLFAQQSGDEGLEKVSLQLHWKYQFEFAGFIAAKEKGFYKDAGLDVTLKEYKNAEDIEQEVLSGKVTYGIYNSLILSDYLQGKPITLLASYFKRPALVLITSPDIKTPKDLVGKSVMTTSKKDFELNFGQYLKSYGVSADSLTFVPDSFRVDEFVDKKVDALSAFISDQPYDLAQKGVAFNILNPSDDNLFILQLELFTSQKEALAHPLRTEAFIEASKKGWEYALGHKEEMVDILLHKYNCKLSKKKLLNEAKQMQRLILPYTYEVGSIDVNFLKKQKELFVKQYHIKDARALENFIFTPYREKEKVHFTQQEEDYIQKHKQVKVCINYQLYPLDGVKNSKLTGEMADIFSIISDMTSLQFLPVTSDSEDDLRKKVQKKECQIISVVSIKNREFPNIRKTDPFSATNFALLGKLENSFIDDPLLLKNKTVIVQKESFEKYLKSLYPYLTIKVENDKNQMVQNVLQGKAYAIVTLDEQADYFIDKFGYGKLKINGFLAKEHPIKGTIGVQKDEPLLFEIIQKALAHISREQIESIRNSWRINRYHTKIDYSLAIKILLFMLIIFLIMAYYQRKLKNFNKKLEYQVNEKTKELREINETLEASVEKKIEELIQKDELLTRQSKQAVMGEMISMIAHQWRQPLNTITLQISNIQLKEMISKDVTKEELFRVLEDINNSVIYLSDTIDDFKNYFHPQKEAQKLTTGSLVSKAVNFVKLRAKNKKIQINIAGDTQTEVSVYVNELIQVLLNILNNAIDAYANVNKAFKEIEIFINVESKNLIITITDHAGGIPKEHIQHIFEPYYSTKGKNGTGLGLYMSQMIIEKQFNGRLKVSSKDKSTTFTIEIPKSL
ncbi:histidine kinase [hydrothermal vent metagenome]|uniref:Thiamine pyrimidine synthase n=1 Tax=hydrothermal vent metagenome TaxID=652676 RepID=A0A1W1CAL9_9ZZZZ